MSEKVFIIGHISPDTDSIVSAICYAWYLREKKTIDAIPARAGGLNPQTSWILKTLNVDSPIYFGDASPRFNSVLHKIDASYSEKPLITAKVFARKNAIIIPLINPDGSPLGMVTSDSFFRMMIEYIGNNTELQQTSINTILNLPCQQAADNKIPRFRASARIKDYLKKILKEEENVFLIIDDKEKYVGVAYKRDLLNPPRFKLILVDHNQSNQAVPSVEEAEIIEIIDHHRLGNSSTIMPIQFNVEPVGSTSTLIAERIISSNIEIPFHIAALLVSGIISDTMNLLSPTTTERDLNVINSLKEPVFRKGTILENDDLKSYAFKVLASGTGLSSRPIKEILTSDIKEYSEGDIKFAIAQAEVTNLYEINEYLQELKHALLDLKVNQRLDFSGLMVTDVVRGSSKIIFSNQHPILEDLPFQKENDGTWYASGLVSRKKQLIPVILSLIKG